MSHSSRDGRFAFDLANHLQASGECRVWMGETAIGLGQNYADEIVRSIRECDAFVLLMSRASLTSAHIRREVSIATSNDKLLLPVALEHGLLDDPDLPDHWRYWLQTAQTTEWTDAATVATAIQRCLGGLPSVPAATTATTRSTHAQHQVFAQTTGFSGQQPQTQTRRKTLLLVGAIAFVVLAALVGGVATVWLGRFGSAAGSSGSTASVSDSPSPAGAASPSPAVTQTHGSAILVATQRDSWGAANVGQCADNSESVKVVNCTELHELEIFAIAKVLNKELLPSDELEIAADEFCFSAYPAYMGDPTAQVGSELYPLWPSEKTWSQGDRSIWCTVEIAPAVKGSIRDR